MQDVSSISTGPTNTKRSVWSEQECLLAIWSYRLLCDNPRLNKTNLYRIIAHAISRTEDAVSFKIQNVSACDPRPPKSKPVSEMEHKQGLLLSLFREYWPKRAELDAIAEELLSHSAVALSGVESDGTLGNLWQMACDVLCRAAEKEFEDAQRTQNKAEEAYFYALRVLGRPPANSTLMIKGLKQRLEMMHQLGTEREGQPRTQRIGQDELHKLVFILYRGCCALCETREPSQLLTSHIVGWAEDATTRLDPANAILLCRLHDGLFDRGLIGFTDEMHIIISSHWDAAGSPPLARAIDEAHFRPPSDFAPHTRYLQRHRERHHLDLH